MIIAHACFKQIIFLYEVDQKDVIGGAIPCSSSVTKNTGKVFRKAFIATVTSLAVVKNGCLLPFPRYFNFFILYL